ncbi:hypothetical protein [Polaromonas sp.]|uniref:hypothetical protein n=1 Tax=Polaromonas sp. TaxID=1869339 RepID=UPI003BB54825
MRIETAEKMIDSVASDSGLWWRHAQTVLSGFVFDCRRCAAGLKALGPRQYSAKDTIAYQFDGDPRARGCEPVVQLAAPFMAARIGTGAAQEHTDVIFRVLTHDAAVSQGEMSLLVAVPKDFFPPLDLPLRYFVLKSFIQNAQRKLEVKLCFASDAVEAPFHASDLLRFLPTRYRARRHQGERPHGDEREAASAELHSFA